MGNMSVKNDNVKKILATDSSFMVNDSSEVHFLVANRKGKHYLQYCNGIELASNPVSTIREYTEHTNNRYVDVNLALAADSALLSNYGEYIQQLRCSILHKPVLDDSPYYRGVDLSPIELEQMERLGTFFLPSFTSTSVDMNKAYTKNSLIVIETPYLCEYGCSITEDLSDYYSSEREVLLACYSAFRLSRIEKANGKNILKLYLDEYLSSSDALSPE